MRAGSAAHTGSQNSSPNRNRGRLGVLEPGFRYPGSMARPTRNVLAPDVTGLPAKPRKLVPHAFVLEALASLSPRMNPMFGCLAIYVEEKIMLILRDRVPETADNGVWLATTEEHHASLRREFPNMRSVQIFGKPITGWQVLPADAP